MDWISVEDRLPDVDMIVGYSDNVLAICDDELMVMCLFFEREDDGHLVWANCYGDINGDGEYDDNYDVSYWMPLPSIDIKENGE